VVPMRPERTGSQGKDFGLVGPRLGHAGTDSDEIPMRIQRKPDGPADCPRLGVQSAWVLMIEPPQGTGTVVYGGSPSSS